MTNRARIKLRVDYYRARIECLEAAEKRDLDLIAHYRRKLAKLEQLL